MHLRRSIRIYVDTQESNALALISAKTEQHRPKLKREISNRLLKSQSAAPANKPYEIVDTRLPGFVLRVQPSGRRSYIVRWGRSNRKTIGHVGVLTTSEARDRAQRVLGNIAHGRDPDHGLVGSQLGLTLGELVNDRYGHWAQAHYANPSDTLTRLKRCFGHWYNLPLVDISPAMIDAWIANRLRNGTAGSTVNRDVSILGAIFSRAVVWEFVMKNPVRQATKCRVDKNPKTRFLSADELQRLTATLAARDDRKRQKRVKGNQWRQERGYRLFTPIGKYGDHLAPMVLLSLHTGCRRGELLSLTWRQVDLKRQLLTLPGNRTKTGQTRIVNLNSKAALILKHWRRESTGLFVFAGPEGKPLSYLKTAWSKVLKEAEIETFRWHDLRHTFASNLVMAQVDLNTVRELLGHSDIAMTLRYAHLASEHKAAAVEKLCA